MHEGFCAAYVRRLVFICSFVVDLFGFDGRVGQVGQVGQVGHLGQVLSSRPKMRKKTSTALCTLGAVCSTSFVLYFSCMFEAGCNASPPQAHPKRRSPYLNLHNSCPFLLQGPTGITRQCSTCSSSPGKARFTACCIVIAALTL